MTNTLITGGAGFIGSHVIKLFVKDKSYNVFNLDSLTYAGSLNNIEGLEKEENYTFIKGDICDKKVVSSLFNKHNFNYVINIAAESHVDRSIETPTLFAETNVLGTLNLLENFRRHYSQNKDKKAFGKVVQGCFVLRPRHIYPSCAKETSSRISPISISKPRNQRGEISSLIATDKTATA